MNTRAIIALCSRLIVLGKELNVSRVELGTHKSLVAPPAGVEPTTYRLGGGRSIH